VHTYEPVTAIRRAARGFALTTSAKGIDHTYQVEKLVLATGGTAHPRRLNIPGEDLPHVHPYWKDPHDYFGKRVLIVGGKNSAVETALRLHHAGARVTMSYRRDKLPAKSIKYWLMPEISGLLKKGIIGDELSTVPVRITPTHVTLKRCGPSSEGLWDGDSQPWDVEADFVVPQIGFVADMSLCRLAGVELRGERETPVYDERTMETNVPGIYVCGTVTGGTQDKYTIFIENGHIHVDRILAHLTGAATPAVPEPIANPES
jgi:thioredoxin reductase (NADPH)